MSPSFSRRLISRLLGAESVVAFTGAGMSAESGVPTFRGDQGIWKKFRPEELASMDAFLRNPAIVWEWYAARKKILAEVKPNPGHYGLAELETMYPQVSIVTQNIDNLHRRAGSSRVYELHGNIERNYCIQCGKAHTDEEIVPGEGAPICVSCGGLVRPDVVWFGELLPMDEWEGAVRSVESADVLLSIGTSGVVFPAAELPLIARRHGAYVVEINPEATESTDWMDESIRGKAADMIPQLVALIRDRRREGKESRPA
jgi:NAD-dependent deacetylase